MDHALSHAVAPARRFRPLAALLHALALRRTRRHLATLDSHHLRDIGLSREQALREADRSLWDAPASWLR